MRALVGHVKEVRGVAFLADGRLASVGSDKTARVWDVAAGTGTVVHKGKGPMYALDVAPDGRTIAVAGRHNEPGTPVTVYDTTTGRILHTLTWTAEDIIWDAERDPDGREVGRLEPVARAIWSLSFAADGRTLAAAGRRPGAANIPNGGGGFTWALTAGDEWIGLPETDAYAVRYGPDGGLAVTARGCIRFYDTPQPRSTSVIADFLLGVREFTEPILRVEEPEAPFTFPVQCDWAPAVTFLPSDGRCAIAAGSYVHLVDPTGNRKPVKLKSGSRLATALAPTPDGRSLLVGGKPGRVEVFDLGGPTPTRQQAFDFDVGGVHGLAVSPDGLTFAVAGDKGLLVCDVETG